jgi:hypothetical protein
MTSDITATSPGGAGGLRRAAEQYLTTRRALGFALSTQGRLLMDFVDCCERHGVATVTTQAALAWATATTRSRDRLWWARRLMVVRIFGICRPWIPSPRCRRQTCCPIPTGAPRPTSTHRSS